MRYFLFRLYVLYIFVHFSSCTLSKANKKPKSSSIKKSNVVQTEGTLEHDLVSHSLKWKDVVDNSEGYNSAASVTNLTTLAYVTPWNNHGYDIAKWQAGRFSLVSPVWLQLKTHHHESKEHGSWLVAGQFDVDHGWMKDVKEAARSKGRETKIVPRIIFEAWKIGDFQHLVDSADARASLSQRLIDVLEAHTLDGYVLELWSQLPHQRFLTSMPAVIADVSNTIRKAGYLVILVIPPPVYDNNSPGMFPPQLFKAMARNVDYFSLMTYDFSNFQRPGPNSPIWWVQKCVELLAPNDSDPDRKKILLGMNMYGLEHTTTGGRHILGRDYVQILTEHTPTIKYDEKSAEHFFEYKSKTGKNRVFYPSVYSIQQRVSLAQKLGTGLSLWEVGQGLNYFYDLL